MTRGANILRFPSRKRGGIPGTGPGRRELFLACCGGVLFLSQAHPQPEEPPDRSADDGVPQLEGLIVTAHQNPVEVAPLTTQQTVLREQIEQMNVVNPENALQYAPNMLIRTRFPGDRNGVISIRGASPFQNARSLVYADGVLLSNLLENRFNGAPRWQVVAPQEIESIRVTYGPYSAEHSGNAMNGVIEIDTRQPLEREATLQTTFFTQDYQDLGVSDRFGGSKTFVGYGDRLGDLSVYGFFQHLESQSQPQGLASVSSPALRMPTGAETVVGGIIRDRDSFNDERWIYGANGFSETVQNLGKLKLAYDVNHDLRLQATLAYWQTIDSRKRSDNFLRDAAGSPFWGGSAVFDGRAFSVRPDEFNTEVRDRDDLLFGLTAEGVTTSDWSYEALFTYYGILRDQRRQSNRNPLDPLYNGSGRVQDFDNTGWLAANLKFGHQEWFGNELVDGFVGLHWDRYEFGVREWNSSNYSAGVKDGALRNDEGGVTSQYAVFGQWDYKPFDAWTITGGARLEYWEAGQGNGFAGGAAFAHPSRHELDVSPKFSIAYSHASEWETRLSIARAVRYPIVTELFQGDPDDRALVIANPRLLPEKTWAGTLMTERFFDDGGSMRLAYFHHRESDTIFNQRVLLASGDTLSTFVNIDRVLTQGVEFAYTKRGWLHPSLDTDFNASYNHARIRENRVDPSIEGNRVPRVPDWRINLLNTWRFTENTQASLGIRYATGAFDRLDNTDSNQNVFGGVSDYFLVNLKASHRFDNGLMVSAGLDNLFNEKYWMFHPFPQRTFILDATWTF